MSRSRSTDELLATTDAAVWARAFVKRVGQPDLEGIVGGWFANAIETGRAAGERAHMAALETAERRAEKLAVEVTKVRITLSNALAQSVGRGGATLFNAATSAVHTLFLADRRTP